MPLTVNVVAPTMSWFTVALTSGGAFRSSLAEAKDQAGILRCTLAASTITIEFASASPGSTELTLDVENPQAQLDFHVESELAGITLRVGTQTHTTHSQAEDFSFRLS